MKQKRNILLIILFCFTLIISAIKSIEEIEEIALNQTDAEITITIPEEKKSKMLYITGSINTEKNYLLISQLDSKLNPSIFVTKKKHIDINKEECDYILHPKENKLVLPSSYFESEKINGFYIIISVEKEKEKEISLKFEFLDEISLEVEEEFSFFTRNLNVENFKININNKSEKMKLKSSIGILGFILSGGNEKQLSMTVNGDQAKSMLNNVLGYWEILDSDNFVININATKNVRFYFKTQIFDEEDDDMEHNYLEENLYNQFFFIKNNRNECFNLDLTEEENEKDLIILSQEKFSLHVYGDEDELFNYNYNLQNNEKYAVSDNLKLNNTVKKICLTLNHEQSENISLIQIYFYDKLNKNEITPESLIPGILYNYVLPIKNTSSELKNNINIHTHSQFFEKNSDQSDIIGINTIIKVLSGKIKVFKDLCYTYPKCSYDKNSSFLQEMNSVNDGKYYDYLKANSDSYSMSNKQTLFIVVCEDEEEECKYEILFSDNQKKSFIKSGDTISKYLGPYAYLFNNKNEDAYYTYLHSLQNKIVINLAVYSGDAYFVQINDIKGCRYEEEHFGSDERRIFHCDENQMDEYYDINDKIELKIEFSIRTRKNGAVYSLYIYEQNDKNEEIYLPVEMAKFEEIQNKNNKFKLLKRQNGIKEIVTLINPINCDINLTNDKNKTFYSSKNNYIQYLNNINSTFDNIILDKYNNYNNIEKCLFYLSSYTHSNEDSFLIITENKPLRIKLDKKLDNVRLQYLYGMTDKNKKIYLKVNVLGNSPLKIKIENNNNNFSNEYLVRDSKIITIMNGNNNDIKELSLDNLSKTKIYVYLPNSKKEVEVDLQIITNLNTPNFLKRGEQISDILINDEYKYFIALINKGSSGNYYINLDNENTGNIYARLLDSDHIKENGWNNRFVLPTYNMDKNKLLPFDFENQKLIVEKVHTQYCNKYCYLIIGVNLHSYYKNIGSNIDTIIGFNSYLKLYDKKDDKIEEKSYIKLMNNEYISSYVTDNENDYFAFNLNNYNPKLNITFNCDNCMMTVVFNDTNFNSEKASKIVSNGDKQELTFPDNLDLRNSKAYIKINTTSTSDNNAKDKNKNNIKYRYSFKINSPNNINETEYGSRDYIDGSMPKTIEFNKKQTHYDYVIKLDKYNSDKDINIIATQNNDKNDNKNKNSENIEIYANIIDDNEEITSDTWPTPKKHDFPKKLNSSNFLTINKKDIKKGENGKDDKIMVVRIYGKENDKIDLYTNYDNINEKNEEKEKEADDFFVPGKYQLITVNNSNSKNGFKIKIPSNLDKNKDYIYKIKRLDGKGKIKYGDDEYEMDDAYDEITIPLDQNIPLDANKIDIKSMNKNKKGNNKYNESFTFQIKYEEKNKFNSLGKMKVGGSKFFSSKDDTESIDHFIPLENVDGDLPISINFDELQSNEEDEYKNQIRNNTEAFDIEGYLVTEDELNEIKNGDLSFLDKKKDYKYKGNYYLENKHGFLNIKKEDIDKHKKNNKNKKTYVYFKMNKSKMNDKKYNKIKGNINLYPSNYTQNTLPENEYHYNSIDCTKKNSHIYKLGDILKNQNEGISSDTHNLTVDFASPIEGLKVKIVKGSNLTEDDPSYFGITEKINDNGKDTITISKNIDDAYLVVETPNKLLNKSSGYNTDIDYMFKYSYKNKKEDKEEKKKPDIKYDDTITYNKMGNTDLKTNITLNKIKDSKTNKSIPCNYYIRIYKNSKKIKSKNKDDYYPKRNVSLINDNNEDDLYAIYKIESNNPLLKNDNEDTFTVPIEIETEDPVFMDVIAETVSDKQTYGYKKGFPNSEDDYDIINDEENEDSDKGKDEDNKNNGNNKGDEKDEGNKKPSLIKIILIAICVLLLLILLIICCIKTCSCSCCSKKERLDDEGTILSGLKDITFHTTDDDGASYN